VTENFQTVSEGVFSEVRYRKQHSCNGTKLFTAEVLSFLDGSTLGGRRA
jgi:hypothetical protein